MFLLLFYRKDHCEGVGVLEVANWMTVKPSCVFNSEYNSDMMGGVENVVRGNVVRAPCRLLILR